MWTVSTCFWTLSAGQPGMWFRRVTPRSGVEAVGPLVICPFSGPWKVRVSVLCKRECGHPFKFQVIFKRILRVKFRHSLLTRQWTFHKHSVELWPLWPWDLDGVLAMHLTVWWVSVVPPLKAQTGGVHVHCWIRQTYGQARQRDCDRAHTALPSQSVESHVLFDPRPGHHLTPPARAHSPSLWFQHCLTSRPVLTSPPSILPQRVRKSHNVWVWGSRIRLGRYERVGWTGHQGQDEDIYTPRDPNLSKGVKWTMPT
jgi:hypothetical protein